MPYGPGKYDDLATYVREQTGGETVLVMVLGGNRGSGFSVQTAFPHPARLAALLREIADEIEGSPSAAHRLRKYRR